MHVPERTLVTWCHEHGYITGHDGHDQTRGYCPIGDHHVATVWVEPSPTQGAVPALPLPESITLCASCAYTVWRDGYPCNRCGGLEGRRYVPDTTRGAVDSSERIVVELDRTEALWFQSAARRAAEDTEVPGARDDLFKLARKMSRAITNAGAVGD